MKKLGYSAFFILVTSLLLLYPTACLAFAMTGLHLWFQNMVPALLPFMILSGIMIRMNLTGKVIALLRPFLLPVFRLRSAPLYAIAVGFLCGFPMGARVVADLYQNKQIDKTEATYLLAFCNNIGPIYFTGFVLPTLSLTKTIPYLIGMYGLPLAYGIFLRYTIYRRSFAMESLPLLPFDRKRSHKEENSSGPPPANLLQALDDSVTAGMEGITKLGGYMIMFNLLNIIPFILLPTEKQAPFFHCLLEITGGLQVMGNSHPLTALVMLSFGGLSCLAQTNSCLQNTDLSLKTYLFHKTVLTLLALGYYVCLFTCFGKYL